jgi:N-acetylmuramoyl-L-alanine amidase
LNSVDQSKYPLPDTSYKRRLSTDTLVIHCAETPPKWDEGVNTVREWHILERGWIDVGYHIFIKRDGTIQSGRPIWSVGAHVEGHNSTSIGVCMAGGCNAKDQEENNFTDAQWESLIKTVKMLTHTYLITVICGHRDFKGVTKYCPSFDVKTWLKQNKKAIGGE